jgi:TolB-like protein/tetratricopeptide (TPR) repeat protein
MVDPSAFPSHDPSVPEPSDKPAEPSLDSWKEIAAYVKRDITTAQRWEKREAMPVHRHVHDKRGSVYAYRSELDAWLRGRALRMEEEEKDGLAEAAADAKDDAKADALPATSRIRLWLSVGGVAVLALVAIVFVTIQKRAGDATQSKIKSLAVLPLKNLSGDPTQEYLADGMTEALIGRLSGIRDLRVISHTSVMRFRNTQLSVPEIAKTLDVDALVEGSVIRDGNRIRVNAQLIRGATDEHFWSEAYDRELRDVLGLQSEVADSIAQKVRVTVTGEERARLIAARPVSPEVYESYLKGRFGGKNSKAEIEESIAYFEEAIKRDPAFAPAYLGLAVAHSDLGTVFVGAPAEQERTKVLSAARKALELDSQLAEAHVLLADVSQERWQWGDAEAEFKRALELEPNDATAHLGFAGWLSCQGRADEAVAWARRGRELDPFAVSGADIAGILFMARRYDEASRELRSDLAREPNDLSALWNLGFVLIAEGKPAEAIPFLEKTAFISSRSPGSIEILATAYALAGRRMEALRLVRELKRRGQKAYVPAGVFINPYLGLGDYDEAFAAFERAYQEKSNILQFLKVHPFFDPVRNDPRFRDLLHRVGLD